MVRGFFNRHLKGIQPATDEPLASATRSPAAVRPGAPAGPPAAPPTTRPAQGGGRPGISWDQIRTREDTNSDAKVTRDEFKGPPPIFDRLDRNKDGSLTKEDFDQPQPGNPGAAKDNGPGAAGPAAESATKPAPVASAPDVRQGFTLDGEKWTYKDGDFAMSGILLKPHGKGPFPAVLISHGLGGSAESFGMNKAREMVQWGLVCIAPNYTHNVGRGGARPGGAAGPAAAIANNYGASAENIRRARACIEILRAMPDVDAKRVAAYGHSMGGFVTIGLAAASPDLLTVAAISGSGVAPRENYPAPSADAAGKVRTPFLMLHGSADTVVRPEQSASFKQVLDGNKVSNQRKVFDGENHPIDQARKDEVFAAIREWFTQYGVLAKEK